MTSSIKYWGTRQRIPPTPGVDAYGAPADGRMDGRELVDKWQQFTIDAAQLMAPSCSFSRGHTHAPSLFICRDANDLLSGNFRTPEPSGTEGRKASAPHAPTPDESWPLAATRGGGNVDRATSGECRIHYDVELSEAKPTANCEHQQVSAECAAGVEVSWNKLACTGLTVDWAIIRPHCMHARYSA